MYRERSLFSKMSMIEAALALVDSRGGGGTAMTMDPEQASPESTSPKAVTAMTMGQEQTSPESTSPEAVAAMTMGPESSEGILPSVHICGSRHRGEFSGKSGQSCHDERPKRFILQWHITHRCNLSCVHCYQNDDVCCAPYESLLDVLDKYERFLQANHYYAYISFYGPIPNTHRHPAAHRVPAVVPAAVPAAAPAVVPAAAEAVSDRFSDRVSDSFSDMFSDRASERFSDRYERVLPPAVPCGETRFPRLVIKDER